MKRFCLIGVLCLLPGLLVTGLVAQEEFMAEPAKHTIKVFEDPQNGAIYWPLDLPMWVRLAAAPEPDAPSYLLQRVMASTTTDSANYNEEGIQLEIPGQQFIRWYNYVTQDTLMLRFMADGVPPQVKSVMNQANKSQHEGQVFYGKGLVCALESVDQASGVAETFISIDGAKFEPYRGELFFGTEKNYTLRFYAVDNVGYASDPKGLNFSVDLTPPYSRHEVVNNYSGSILSPKTTLRLSSVDKLTKAHLRFRFDEEEERAYKGSDLTLDHLTDGQHRLSYYAVDDVENREHETVFTFFLDKSSPTIESAVHGDQHSVNGKTFVSRRTTVNLAAEDNKIGLDRIEYRINNAEYEKYSTAFPVPVQETKVVIRYRAADKLNNTSAEGSLTLHMDKTPPTTAYSFKGPNSAQRGSIWISTDSEIILAGKDSESGVQTVYYKIGEEPETAFTEPFKIANEGRYDFRFWSVDQVNNRQEAETLVLVIGSTPPELVETFSVLSTESAKDEEGNTIQVYPQKTSVFLGGTDKSASIAGIWYSINGSKEISYNAPLNFSDEGTFTLVVRAQDKVGNETRKVIKFAVQN